MTYQCCSLILVLIMILLILVLRRQLPAQLIAPKVCLDECRCLIFTSLSSYIVTATVTAGAWPLWRLSETKHGHLTRNIHPKLLVQLPDRRYQTNIHPRSTSMFGHNTSITTKQTVLDVYDIITAARNWAVQSA